MFRSDPPRADDGRTVLAPGVIRPYKGLDDAVTATLAVPTRASSWRATRASRSTTFGARRATGPSGGSATSARRSSSVRFSESTVAVFPYRAELDQSGALLQALGARCPAVVYDVGGLGEVVGRFEAGRVVPPGDVEALSRAIRELVDDPARAPRARAGAARARDELTWDAAAGAHLDLYRELL